MSIQVENSTNKNIKIKYKNNKEMNNNENDVEE